ncbi:MAG TPA: peptide ABC transporter substrate-binding protein [Candidatus Nitrosotalea sp.]|nr:peptide ABC transporter substrate-binding protein [Candidatus Nitrosotalea sp.]
MTRSSKIRSFGAVLCAAAIAAACGPTSTPSEALAADQTYRFGITDDVTSIDPGHVITAVDIVVISEVFTGLYKFDNNLKIQPSGATALPTISPDGKTWTFNLRKDMVFSNGDKITSADWVYSWTRTLRLNDAYASNLEPIMGATDVEAGTATKIAGLSAPDAYTLVAKLVAPAGYWLTELAMPVATEVVDQKVITAAGEDTWTNSPSTYIGSGPFKMTQRTPKAAMDFQPVKNWWGGDTGKLTAVHIDIGLDDVSRVKKFESGGYEVVGPANSQPGPDDVLRYRNDPIKSKLLNVYVGGRTTAVGFNFTKGPFAQKPGVTPGDSTVNASDPGLDGRRAFSMAIDRVQLADIACAHAVTCQPAYGGPITKGFIAYAGDNTDTYAKFDAGAAKALYTKWDPDGSKVKGLEYRYNTSAGNTKIATNLQAQWKQNLGVDVKLVPSDFPTLVKDRQGKKTIIFRESWGIDYDHPQDWFDNLFICSQAKVGRGNNEGYCNPALDAIVSAANAKPITDPATVAEYNKASKMIVNDVVWATLFYGTQPYLTQTYVRGTGYNGLYDYNWEGIRLLQH